MIDASKTYCRELYQGALGGWDRFWFKPADPATYCLLRILAGAMLFYTHLAWTLELENFFGPHPWLSVRAVTEGGEVGLLAWSHLWYIQSPALLWTLHVVALVVLLMFTLGLFSRVTSVLSALITVSYAHRVPGALFGLDQINAMLAMYLAVGPSGACYSLDRWLARRRCPTAAAEVAGSVSANIGVRLIQLHMCVIYIFAAVGKLQGNAWWDGTAMWLSVANLEYQSLDATWLAHWPLLTCLLTHVSLCWELSYSALIWPRLTRPLVLVLAVPLHLGIAMFLGMITFGLVMLIGNAAFISPALVRACLQRRGRPRRRVETTTGQRVGKTRRSKTSAAEQSRELQTV